MCNYLKEEKMKENEITGMMVNAFYKIHTTLGPGLLESVYEEVICYELEKAGIMYSRQREISVPYDGIILEKAFRADIIIMNKVIIEIKSVENVLPVHCKQLLTYLRLTDIKVGLLVNFNVDLIKNGVRRIVNGHIE
jgi:GxxExxY protein